MDESRKQFESEMEKLGDCVDMRRAKNGDEEYMEWDVRLAWRMWQASRAAIEIDVEKLKIELENLECAQICLDEAGVPRKEGSEELSMWGRIVRYAAVIKVKE